MSDFLVVLELAALPGAANFFGGGLAELVPVGPRTLSLTLHVAAGIVLAVVGLELLPEALNRSQPWVPILGSSPAAQHSSACTGASASCRHVWVGPEAKASRAHSRSSVASQSTSSATAS